MGTNGVYNAVCFLCSFCIRHPRRRTEPVNARLYQAMQTNPIIAAIRDDAGLEGCLKADVQIVFVLYGDICSIAGIVERIKDAGKMAIVHVDLITGLSGKEICVDFLRNATRADGIISTRANMIQRAKELQMITVFRVFVIDSMALDSLLGVKNLRPDAIDILPGLMPGIICKVRTLTGLPVLAGGSSPRSRRFCRRWTPGPWPFPARLPPSGRCRTFYSPGGRMDWIWTDRTKFTSAQTQLPGCE